MNGTALARMPMMANFLPKALNAPMALWPVLRPRALSAIMSAKPKVTTKMT